MAKITCEKCGTVFEYKVVKDFESCPVCGASFDEQVENVDAEDRSDWITWYYYGFKDKKGNKTEITSLMDKPMDLEKFGDTHYLIKEFQAPPRDMNGKSDAAKKELRKYVPDAFQEAKTVPKVQCPYCFSTEVQLLPKKFSLFTGIMTNGFNRVCVRCQRKF